MSQQENVSSFTELHLICFIWTSGSWFLSFFPGHIGAFPHCFTRRLFISPVATGTAFFGLFWVLLISVELYILEHLLPVPPLTSYYCIIMLQKCFCLFELYLRSPFCLRLTCVTFTITSPLTLLPVFCVSLHHCLHKWLLCLFHFCSFSSFVHCVCLNVAWLNKYGVNCCC